MLSIVCALFIKHAVDVKRQDQEDDYDRDVKVNQINRMTVGSLKFYDSV